MKKILLFLFISLFIIRCSSEDSSADSSNNPCEYNGHKLYKGVEGGCYYYNSNGGKEYVDRSHCDC